MRVCLILFSIFCFWKWNIFINMFRFRNNLGLTSINITWAICHAVLYFHSPVFLSSWSHHTNLYINYWRHTNALRNTGLMFERDKFRLYHAIYNRTTFFTLSHSIQFYFYTLFFNLFIFFIKYFFPCIILIPYLFFFINPKNTQF